MKGYEQRNLNIESNSDFDSKEMSIDSSDMGFIFDVLMKQMYRDPIGSIIREITSNCFDSHHEAKVDDAVVIKFEEDDNGSYIGFQDFGVGLSPERINKVYTKIGKSTKRDDPNAIGYFGLGSKSPLAYVEEGFYIDTIFEGTKYYYFVHKGETVPEVTLLMDEPTEERNGSTVKIYFNKESDKTEFQNKLEDQLRYFDNVFVIGAEGYFNNDYELHIGKTFKYRSDVDSIVGLHLCIGKVTYPIDWEKLGINKRIDLPFALKFEIGDLPITPEREGVRYAIIKREDGIEVDTRQIIISRINEFKEEIQDLVGREPQFHNNYFDWYDSQEKFGEVYLLGNNIKIPVTIANYPPQYYKPLYDVKISTPTNLFFYRYEKCKFASRYYGEAIVNFDKAKGQRVQALTIRDFDNYLVVREFTPINKAKTIKIDYLRKLAEESDKNGVIFIRYNHNERARSYFKIPTKNNDLAVWNSVKYLNYIKEVVEREVILNSIDYHTLEIPKEFEDEWNEKHKKRNDKEVWAEDGEIVVDNIKSPTARKEQAISLEFIEESIDTCFVYGFTKNLEALQKLESMLGPKLELYVEVYRIRQRDEKLIVGFRNTIHVESLMTSNNPIFRKLATAIYINRSKIQDYKFFPRKKLAQNTAVIDPHTAYELIFYPLEKKLRELVLLSTNTLTYNDKKEENKLENEILQLAIDNNWLEQDIVKAVKMVEDYFKDLELFNHIVPTYESLPLIAKFVKQSGKKVNPEWEQLEEWQKSLMQELQDKFSYVKGLRENLTTSLSRMSSYSDKYKLLSLRNIAMQDVEKDLEEVTMYLEIFNPKSNDKKEVQFRD